MQIRHGEIHVWLLWHDRANVPKEFDRILSEDESARASRFINERAKFEFSLTRAALRQLLADYIGSAAGEVEFEYDRLGKPRLAAVHAESAWLQFNAAHTRSLSAFAVIRGSEIGVDVEFHRDVSDADRIVSSKFADEEQKAYFTAPPQLRPALFFRGWTRKEAFIKATGQGLSQPLKSFAVTIDSADSPRLTRIDNDRAGDWSLFDLNVGVDHSGAVAVRQASVELECREFHFP